MLFYIETRYHTRTTQKLSTWLIWNFHIKENPATKTDNKPDMSSESQTPPWQSNLSKKNRGVVRYHHQPAGLSPREDFIARPKKHQHSPSQTGLAKSSQKIIVLQELLLMELQLTTKHQGLDMVEQQLDPTQHSRNPLTTKKAFSSGHVIHQLVPGQVHPI